MTFFSKRESNPTEGTLFQQADLRSSIYNELNGDLTGRTENTLDLAALIVWHSVTVLLDRSTHPDLEIFRIFDEAIGMLVCSATTIATMGIPFANPVTVLGRTNDAEYEAIQDQRTRHGG